MGGCGSGRWGWYIGKRTVEETGIIDIDALIEAGLMEHKSGVIEWMNPASGVRNHLRYLLVPTDNPSRFMLGLFYTLSWRSRSEKHAQRIALVSKPQRLGGVRWYFFCPMSCNRIVRKLYCVLGTGYACRHCQKLTYTSCKEHDSRRGVFRHNPERLRAAVKAGLLLAMGYSLAQERRRERKLLALTSGVTITSMP